MFARSRAAVGLALAQLRHARVRTALSVCGVALAVLLMVLLAGLGYGVVDAGSEGIAFLDQDLWVTGGPVELAPTSVGGVENRLTGAHAVADDIESRPAVESAVPLSFQSVYVARSGPGREDYRTVVGVGAGEGALFIVQRGREFQQSDVHYANGSYDGPRTDEVVVDQGTASLLNVSVGDTINAGATIADARENEFMIVGISRTYSTFLGTPTAAFHLSELQAISGTTGTDRASLVTVTLSPGADGAAVQRDIERTYPDLTVRTNRQQLQAVLGGQAAVLGGAVTLVALAIVAGIALVVNVLALLVHQQREELAALKAAGVSGRTLVGMVAGQGVLIGALGAALGLAATPPLVALLNRVTERLTGFPDLVDAPLWVLAAGGSLALVMGVVGAVVAGWRVARIRPLEHLER